MPEGADQPAFAVHRQVARSPNGRQTHVARKYGVVRGELAQGGRYLLRVYQASRRARLRKVVKVFARVLIMMTRIIEMRLIDLLVETRQQRSDRRGDIAHEAQLDRRAAAQVLGSDIDLRDVHAALGIELSVREVSAEHQQSVAILHRGVDRE